MRELPPPIQDNRPWLIHVVSPDAGARGERPCSSIAHIEEVRSEAVALEIVAHPPSWVSTLLRPKQHILATRGSETGPCLSFSRVLKTKGGRAVLVTVGRSGVHRDGIAVPVSEAVNVDVQARFLRSVQSQEPAIRHRVLGHRDHTIGTVWNLMQNAGKMLELAESCGASKEAALRSVCSILRTRSDIVQSQHRAAYDGLLEVERRLRGEGSDAELREVFRRIKHHADDSWDAWPFVRVIEVALGEYHASRVVSLALPYFDSGTDAAERDRVKVSLEVAREALVGEVTLAEVTLVPSLKKSLR